MKRIGILTSGGDCPGLNAVIRAVYKKANRQYGYQVIGIEDGFEGLLRNKYCELTDKSVSNILTQGGTILGTSNRADVYRYPVMQGDEVIYQDLSRTAIKNVRQLKLDCLVCVGGDGTLMIANRLSKEGVPIVGIPKTIDNDVLGTDVTFGFDTAVHIATDGLDRLHTTAQSHHRVMLLEVMGRRSGWIALHTGLAGGGDIILIPEIPYDIKTIVESIKERKRKGKRFTLVVVSEGARAQGGEVVVRELVKDGAEPIRLGGVSFVIGKAIEKLTGIETRNVVMGHLQRGGSPSPVDRILGTRLGTAAVDLIAKKEFGYMVGVDRDLLVKVPLSKAGKGQRLVPVDHHLIKTGVSLGVCFGAKLPTK